MDEAPKAPWSPFPLVELCVLVALVLIVVGVRRRAATAPRRASSPAGSRWPRSAGLELALREHFAGYRSHSALLAGAVAVVAVVPLFFFTGAAADRPCSSVGVVVCSRRFFVFRRAFQALTGGHRVPRRERLPDPAGPAPESPRRMRLTGLHHVTAICADLDRTTAFYRDVLGLALVREGANDDDPDARHFWFGAPGDARHARVVHGVPRAGARAGGAGSTHHFAFAVGSAEELEAWRDYLRGARRRVHRRLRPRRPALDLPARPRRPRRRDRDQPAS